MLSATLELLSKPYRQARFGAVLWKRSLLFGAFVCLFLALFRPFGLDGIGERIWPIALGYGAVCSAIMLVMNTLVPLGWPSFFDEERWTVGREIGWSLLNVLLIGAGNALYSVGVGFVDPSWNALLWFELYTLLIGLFPVTVVVLSNEARLSRHYREGSKRVNAGIEGSAPTVVVPRNEEPTHPPDLPLKADQAATITLPSENGREDLTLSPDDLLFLRSAGNYVEVHHLHQGRPVRPVMRASLKRLEEALSPWPRFLRCHKSHVVNLHQVVRVSGNAQGYRLHLREDVDAVPVSRQLNDRLEELLAGRR